MIGNMIGKRQGRSRHCITAALAALVTATVCSCSSSAGDSHPPPSPPAPRTSTATSTAASTGAGNSTSTGVPADAATESAIKDAYRTLFAPSTPLEKSIAALQHGAEFRQALIEQGKSPMAKNSSASVSKVTLLSPELARVTYSILLAGAPVLPGQTGYAVREDGTWKVADKTFCGLLALNGSTPAACERPGATALPGAG